jgi:hypothetical protein
MRALFAGLIDNNSHSKQAGRIVKPVLEKPCI